MGALILALCPMKSAACCAVASIYHSVVNASQTVIMIWDKERETQHFIRKADFRTDAKDIGFLVPSPSRPQLEESGNEAFQELARITAPAQSYGGGFPLGCSVAPQAARYKNVTVIEEKRVAGYDATVLTARSGDDLVNWLKENGYAYSPAVADWAKPYLGGSWHFTALKLAKQTSDQDLKASALRITFKTNRPLFPYREPDSRQASSELDAQRRLLRIYFIADTQYVGKINGTETWSGKTKWSGDITSHRTSLLGKLNLPPGSAPTKWWLTEFEDAWPYEKAAGDVYFSPAEKQKTITRDGFAHSSRIDASGFLMAACLLWVMGSKRQASLSHKQV
jgi:hypothetical protein